MGSGRFTSTVLLDQAGREGPYHSRVTPKVLPMLPDNTVTLNPVAHGRNGLRPAQGNVRRLKGRASAHAALTCPRREGRVGEEWSHQRGCPSPVVRAAVAGFPNRMVTRPRRSSSAASIRAATGDFGAGGRCQRRASPEAGAGVPDELAAPARDSTVRTRRAASRSKSASQAAVESANSLKPASSKQASWSMGVGHTTRQSPSGMAGKMTSPGAGSSQYRPWIAIVIEVASDGGQPTGYRARRVSVFLRSHAGRPASA